MNNTATATIDQATATEESVSLFMSKCINQKLFVKQPYTHVQNGIPVVQLGESIEFVNHEFRTSDPRLKEFIRNHRLFGTKITEVTESDFGRVPRRSAPNMIRGAMTTKPTTPEVPSITPETSEVDANRYADLIAEALAENPDHKVAIPCGFEDCEYVATAEDEATAKRSLNGHRTVRGHHPKSPE